MKAKYHSALILTTAFVLGTVRPAAPGVSVVPSQGGQREYQGDGTSPPVQVKPAKKNQPAIQEQETQPPAPTEIRKKPAMKVKTKILCQGKVATIVAKPEGGTLKGTPGPDIIAGLGGADEIDGMGGDDVICGGGGDDVIKGGPGHDRIEGGHGADRLLGGGGNDMLFGGPGRDVLNGGPGDDILDGGGGLDSCSNAGAYGGKALGCEDLKEDLLSKKIIAKPVDKGQKKKFGSKVTKWPGGPELPPPKFEAGKEIGDPEVQPPKIEIGKAVGDPEVQPPKLEAGKGVGDIEALPPETEMGEVQTAAFKCVGKTATIVAGARGGHSVWKSADDGQRVLSPTNIVYGTPGDDVIVGTPGDDYIRALEGNDWVCGGGGNDRIWGDEGDDYLYGGPGDDRLYGKQGTDRLYGGPGNDHLEGEGEADFLFGGEGDDTLVGHGGDDELLGGDGDDELHGGQGDDFLSGLDGNDKLIGWTGNDTLHGWYGDDKLYGGPGTDSLDGGEGFDICDPGPPNFGSTFTTAPKDCENPELEPPLIGNVYVQPHGTYAEFFAVIWSGDSVTLRIHNAPVPIGRECDSSLDSARHVQSGKVEAGTVWSPVVKYLDPGRTYVWELCPSWQPEYRKHGKFETKRRRVEITIDSVKINDDSDHHSAGECQFSFFMDVQQGENCKFDSQASYPPASKGEVTCDSGDTLTFNPPIRLAKVGARDRVTVSFHGRDLDNGPHAYPYWVCPAPKDGIQCAYADQGSTTRTFKLGSGGDERESFYKTFTVHTYCPDQSMGTDPSVSLSYYGNLRVDYVAP